MISPINKYKKLWDFLVLVIIHMVIVEVPLRLTLGYQLSPFGAAVHIAVSLFLFLDIILTFNTAIAGKFQLVHNRRKVAIQYLITWFAVDLLGAVPWDLFLPEWEGPADTLLKLSRVLLVLRLARWEKIKPALSWLQLRLSLNAAFFRLGAFLALILLIAHWITCGWIILWLGGGSDASGYLKGYYWTVTTLTTVGYGDITPSGNLQIMYTMMVEFLGVGFYGFVIGNIANLLREVDVVKATHKKKLNRADAFLNHKNIPFALRQRVHEYYDLLWASRKGTSEADILEELPPSLRTDISIFINREILQKVPLFREADELFLRELAGALEPVIALPGDFIIRRGEAADRMYFINRGSVQIFKKGDYVASLESGNYFGEMSLLEKGARNADVVADGVCELYALGREAFERVLDRYPRFKQHIYSTVKNREQEG